MHGTPLIRVIALTAALAVMGLIVSAITRGPATPTPPDSPDPAMATAEAMLPAQLSVLLSAPAHSLSISAGDTQTVLVKPHLPEGTASDFRFEIPIIDHSATLLLNVAWETPAPNNFLRLVLETDALETKELVLHAPVNLESHAITFTWLNPEP